MRADHTIVSLCTGFGALDQAVQEVCGGELVAVADTDRASSRLLAHHHPEVPNLGDITTVDWTPYIGSTWVTAGWPCQPWSTAGRQKGADDERAIWPAVARAVRDIRPRHVLLENVPRIAAAGELARAIGDLAALGYVGSWRCISAASVGAPHQRDRIFIVASDAEDERHERSGAPRRGRHGPEDGRVATADPASPGRRGSRVASREQAQGGESFGFTRRRADDATSVADREVEWRAHEAAIQRWERALGRPAPGPTVLGPKGGRVLSPYFDEWLMGAPEGWITSVPGLSRADMVKLCGNGVVRQAAVRALQLMSPSALAQVA